MDEEQVDRVGAPVQVGYKVAFGCRVGNRGAVRTGRVADVVSSKSRGVTYRIETDGGRVTFKPPSGVVVYSKK